MLRRVDRDDFGAQQQLGALGGPALHRTEQQVRLGDLPGQVSLGQRRPLVRRDVLGRPDLGLVAVPGSECRDVSLDWGLVWSAKLQMSSTARRIADTIHTLMAEVVSDEKSFSASGN
ncbi:hypothetical protein [Streptomyces sp. NPDC001037]|uniref:hypothetical protein n=1 Tax=Streptomyces sp. NPDC001037 TaxID=3364542 RepID=UPI003691E96B